VSSDKADAISIQSSRYGNNDRSSTQTHENVGQGRRSDIASAASESVAPSPTEADFPLDHLGAQIRRGHDGYHVDGTGLEYMYDDPRRPYYCQNLSPSRTSWHHPGGSTSSSSNAQTSSTMSTNDARRSNPSARSLAAGSSGITSSSGYSKTGSFGSSAASSSFEEVDNALPFAHGGHYKNSSSFASSAPTHSDSESGKHPMPSNRPYTGPDRYVKTVLTYSTAPPSNRKGNRGGGNSGSGAMGQADRPLSLKSMAKGPEGSNRVAVAANDGKPKAQPIEVKMLNSLFSPSDSRYNFASTAFCQRQTRIILPISARRALILQIRIHLGERTKSDCTWRGRSSD
jgi:hypothetical protein